MTERLGGVLTALVTPFDSEGKVDAAALRRFVRWQIEEGVAGLAPCGTTGEGATLEPAEHELVVQIAVEEASRSNRPVTVVAGAGTNDTRRTIALARRCKRAGADALLVVTPYYNKPTQSGMHDYFREVADSVDLPIVVYNVPGRTGVNLLPETVLRLAEDARFAGVKEASGNLDQASQILRSRPDRFAVLSGEDSLTLPMVALGADGGIAVVSNEAPAAYSRMVEDARTGDFAAARKIHARLFPLMRANFCESNPIPVKWAVARMGWIGNRLRSPLSPLSPSFHATVERAMAEAGIEAVAESAAKEAAQ
ncbi:MAG TPA: 4-hydroxy-tetrahydrodipicolinate synthase [Thermoanaerobaculia bacterium]|nr:4-hydroxy-tetrahydrodipicolinate synthase [Thermoanaerobaculia bacterium]